MEHRKVVAVLVAVYIDMVANIRSSVARYMQINQPLQ